jgi:hypothetical protein
MQIFASKDANFCFKRCEIYGFKRCEIKSQKMQKNLLKRCEILLQKMQKFRFKDANFRFKDANSKDAKLGPKRCKKFSFKWCKFSVSFDANFLHLLMKIFCIF